MNKKRLLLAQCENLIAAMQHLKDSLEELSPNARQALQKIKGEGVGFYREVRKLRQKLENRSKNDPKSADNLGR